MKTPAAVEKAHTLAVAVRGKAHAPYSHFQVGAALKLQGQEELIGGCNVENASFGGTVCAERVALFSAVAKYGGTLRPEFLVVVTGEKEATVPCALCLQGLAEFAADDLPIYLGNESGIVKMLTLRELLPHPFRSFQGEKR